MRKQVASADPALIKQGFSVNEITMGDAENGKKLWTCSNSEELNSEVEVHAFIPKEILSCKSVSRDVNFSSAQVIKDLRLEQTFKLHGQPFEFFAFQFGFVIPGSTNNWQQIIEASDQMMAIEVLSGNLEVETKFFDGKNHICTTNVRIFYV